MTDQDDFRELETVVVQCIGSGGKNYNTLMPGDVFYTCNCSLKCPYQVEEEDHRPYCKVAG